jgi:hypothetical protein
MNQNEFCYYEVVAGIKNQGQKAKTDAFLQFKINMVINTNIELVIARNINDDYVDFCKNISPEELIFVRHPFKIFLLLESTSSATSTYFLELKYTEEADLSQFVNNKKCYRRKNSKTEESDPKVGSTIGGKYQFGYATDSKNDENRDGKKEDK